MGNLNQLTKMKENNFASLSEGPNKRHIEMDPDDGHLVNVRLYDTADEIESVTIKYLNHTKFEAITPEMLDERRESQVIIKPDVAGVVSLDFMQDSRPGSAIRAEGGLMNIDVALATGATQTHITYTEKRLIAL